MQKPILLLGEENPRFSRELKELPTGDGFRIIESPSSAITLDYVQGKSIDLLIVVASSGHSVDALELAHQVREWDRRLPLI